jgi:HK97 family phage major capsid protein
LAQDTISGSGSSQPFGIFNRLMGVTTSPAHIVVTTAGQLGAVDVRKAWQALPQRWRDNATWLANGSVETLVRQFANGDSEVDFQSTLAPDGTRISALEGRPFISTDYAPDFAGHTAGTLAAAVVGDFRGGFRVISRAGMEVELVKNVPNLPTAGVPTMQRGWYATARLGWDAVVNDAFRIIANA